MVTQAQKIRLGVFLTISISFLIILVISIVGKQIMEKRDTYFIKYQNVSVNGLQIGGAVKYNGIRVGRVENISIDKEDITQVIVEISLDNGTPIKKDVVATLVPVGITGLKSVELSGGSNAAEFLQPNDFINAGISSFDNITGKAEVIAEKIEVVLNNVINLTSDENRKKFDKILSDVQEIIGENKGEFNNIVTNLDSITINLASFSNEIDNLMKSINTFVDSDEMNKVMSNAVAFSDSLNKVDIVGISKNLDKSINQLNSLISNVNLTVLRGRQDALSSLETLKEAMDNLNEFSRLISDDPSILIKSKSKK